MTTSTPARSTGRQEPTTTPTDVVLSASLLLAPLVYLAADSTYAVRGWDDAAAAVLHVIGAVAYGFVGLRVAGWLPQRSRLGAAVLVTGMVGMAGNVAYGFDTLHVSLGAVSLVDQPGAANLIKPLGLFVPVFLLLLAAALHRLGHRWQAALVLLAALAWPVGHIVNLAPAAVGADVALVVALGSLLWPQGAVRPLPR